MYNAHLQTVLLIDDNPNDRLIVKRELNREFESIAIHEIIDQKQFDLALAAADFDFVITDFQLGWSNGLKTLRAIRERSPDCPVIMFTNTGTQEIAVEAMKSGLDDYVIKSPQHFVRLRQAVRSVWQKYQTKLKADELERRLRALLNQLDIGIFRATQEGRLLDINAATLEMLGVESLEEAQVTLARQLAMANQPAGVSYTREIELRRPSESSAEAQPSLWLKIIATPSQVNNEILIDGLIEDITPQKQAEQALNQLNQTLEAQIQQRTEQLETTNQELELFAYSISHDLRTPVRQIGGFVGLLKEALISSADNQLPDNGRVSHYLTILSELTEQANTMIDALLTFSRTGRTEMVYEPVDMTKVVQQLISQAEENVPTRQIQWKISALPVVACDRTLIVSVWQNLIGNAVKFTQNQAVARICIGAQVLSEETIFSIEDNGIGFKPEQADRIFGMFQQAHRQEIPKGTGMGLASVKRIVTRHGGRVWADGRLDKGATFYFSLPNRSEQ